MNVKLDRNRKILFATTLLFASSQLGALAEDAKSFSDASDTKFSVQYVTCKQVKKNSKDCVAVYKVLDVQQVPEMQTQPMAGDVLELAYSSSDGKEPATASDALPWAELKSDGMVSVHIPNKYLRKRATTSAETIWRIDNKENKFGIVKPKEK